MLGFKGAEGAKTQKGSDFSLNQEGVVGEVFVHPAVHWLTVYAAGQLVHGVYGGKLAVNILFHLDEDGKERERSASRGNPGRIMRPEDKDVVTVPHIEGRRGMER